jgi:hypothetical protein
MRTAGTLGQPASGSSVCEVAPRSGRPARSVRAATLVESFCGLDCAGSAVPLPFVAWRAVFTSQ